MVLDGGARGIIAPSVESVSQVLDLVGAVIHKQVKGGFLKEHMKTSKAYGPNLVDYIENSNTDNILIINIESKAGIAWLNEILEVKDLDGVLIGSNDLSCSLGIPKNYHLRN
jgi:4-hydroxy-2-oxoheptanedioate aldolase